MTGLSSAFTPKGTPTCRLSPPAGGIDALTRELGNGAECPAVGGVLRPTLMLAVTEAAT